MPCCSPAGTLSVPMSMPRYTAVESHAMISPSNRRARARASALLPVAVGPTTAASFIASAVLAFVVVERDGEEGTVGRVVGRQHHRGIRHPDGVGRRDGECVDRRGLDDADVD